MPGVGADAPWRELPLSQSRACEICGDIFEKLTPRHFSFSHREGACPTCDGIGRKLHEDMRRNFSAYPRLWGMSGPDPNIDHRRVPNLRTYFRRRGAERDVSAAGGDYRAGDMVTQLLPGGLAHIGIVSDTIAEDGATPLVIHNIGAGAQRENTLFAFEITGHYRFAGT